MPFNGRKTCAVCEKTLAKKQYWNGNKFCSRACYRAWFQKIRGPQRFCATCGKPTAHASGEYRKYCSLKCSDAARTKERPLCRCGCGRRVKQYGRVYFSKECRFPLYDADWQPSPELIEDVRLNGYLAAALKINLNKNTLISRLYSLGYRFQDEARFRRKKGKTRCTLNRSDAPLSPKSQTRKSNGQMAEKTTSA